MELGKAYQRPVTVTQSSESTHRLDIVELPTMIFISARIEV
jgi:hypothetical protein